jgi:hypothetical protein
MRGKVVLTLAALLGLTVPSWAGLLCRCAIPQCGKVPETSCPAGCDDSCGKKCSLTLFGEEHAKKLLEQLKSCDVCDRLSAIKKLGCCLHVNACKDPCVVNALLDALFTDPIWEVRRAAGYALMKQKVRTEVVVLALYLSSKIDPHVMVRMGTADAVDRLTLGKAGCYDDLYAAGDRLVRELKKKKFVVGRPGAHIVIDQAPTGSEMAILSSDVPGPVMIPGHVVVPAPEGIKLPAAVTAAPATTEIVIPAETPKATPTADPAAPALPAQTLTPTPGR